MRCSKFNCQVFAAQRRFNWVHYTWLFSQGSSLPLAPSDDQLDKSEPAPYRTALSFMSQLTPLNFVHRIKAECMYDDEEARWILPAMKIEKTSLPAAGNNQN